MKIRDDSELANVMSRALEQYANRVQNGAVEPYKSFMSGAESVDVTVTLSGDGTITVKTPEKVEEGIHVKQFVVERQSPLPGVITL